MGRRISVLEIAVLVSAPIELTMIEEVWRLEVGERLTRTILAASTDCFDQLGRRRMIVAFAIDDS
jgi:hypothetical protein